jgi:hypothetical protein
VISRGDTPAGGPWQSRTGIAGIGWSTEAVDSNAWSPSLALDSEGHPSIAYSFFNSTEEGLGFTSLAGSAWSNQLVCCSFVDDPALVFDRSGFPRVAFTYDRVLEYVARNGTGWSGSAWLQDDVQSVSLAIDARGGPHIGYFGYRDQSEFLGLSYAHQDDGTWTIEEVDPDASPGATIAVDSGGAPHVAYLAAGGLKYATRLRLGLWEIETVEGVGVDGQVADPPEREVRSTRLQSPAVISVGDGLPLNIAGLFGTRAAAPHEHGWPDPVGTLTPRPGHLTAEGITALALPEGVAQVTLAPARPNPSSDPVRFHFSLPREAQVSLVIFDAQGRRIRTLANRPLAAGWRELWWNGTNDVGDLVGPGLYFARMSTEGQQVTQRIVRLR